MNDQIKQSPLRIYLDTSDYSRFADIGYRSEPGLPDILNFLREKKEQGAIEIRFSGVHLFEFLKDPSQRMLALRKVRIMEELCGDQAFRHFFNVFDLELESLQSGIDPGLLVTTDEGEWLPQIELSGIPSLDSLMPGLLEQFPILDAAEFRESLRSPESAKSLKEYMASRFPLAKVYDSDLHGRFLSGLVSGQEMSRELVKGFSKPSILIEHYLEGKPDAQKFFSLLSQFERRLQKSHVSMQEALKSHLASVVDLDKKTFSTYVRKLFDSVPLPSYLNLTELPSHLREALDRHEFLKVIPAMSVHYNVLSAYRYDIVSLSLPEIKESDAGDMLHATYLPYVDLYRTDGRFASLLAKVPKPSMIKVVPKLSQLPEEIEKKLAERSKTGIG